MGFLSAFRPNPNSVALDAKKSFTFCHNETVDFLDHYDLLEDVNGFANAFLCKHKASEEVRTVRKLRKADVPKATFDRQINVLKHLDHPNLLKLYESFEDKRYYYLVTERLDHDNLYDCIEKSTKQGSYGEQWVANAMEILLGVAHYCHENSVVLGSLKPKNILVPTGKTVRHLIVVGFDYANFFYNPANHFQNEVPKMKRMSYSVSSSSRTASTFAGSSDEFEQEGDEEYIARRIARNGRRNREFMAPETVSNQDVLPETDVYAIGVMAYQMLCGKLPFPNGPPTTQAEFDRAESSRLYQEPNWESVPDAKSFVQSILTFDTEERLRAEDAFDDAWLPKRKETYEERIEVNVVQSLKQYNAETKLQKAVLSFMTQHLVRTSDETDQLDSIFRSMDGNVDGRLSKDEIKDGLNRHETLQLKDVLEILERMDVNGSGFVEYTEFVLAASHAQMVKDVNRMKTCFDMLDSDHNGFLEVRDLKTLFNSSGGGKILHQEMAKAMIRKADANHDGKLSYKEFIDMMMETTKLDENSDCQVLVGVNQ